MCDLAPAATVRPGYRRGRADTGPKGINMEGNVVFQHARKISLDRRPRVSATDELLRNADAYRDHFNKGDLPLPPRRRVAVVACMDARLNPHALLGLEEGDAHVIRNAGGVVTDDAIRSLAISQRLLGTEEVILIHHTDCGMLTFGDDEFRRSIEADTGIRPPWAAEAFGDLEQDVRQSIARIRTNPFIPRTDRVRGFVYDVATGELSEVS
jgi:carbonic anhydrase